MKNLTLLLGILCVSLFSFSQEISLKRKISELYVNNSRPQLKANACVCAGGQSNIGRNQSGFEYTGRINYATINPPVYLQTAPANIRYIKNTASVLSLENWVVDPSQEWGWFNQFLYNLSFKYTNIIYGKSGQPGTTILPGGGGTFNRTDFFTYNNFAIAQCDAQFGSGNYNLFVVWDLGETNGLTLGDASVFQTALTEWFLQIRTTLTHADSTTPIFFNLTGYWQNTDFPYVVSHIQPAQIAVANTNPTYNILISGNASGKNSLQDQISLGDYSHYDWGAISLGTNYSDRFFSYYSTNKADNTPPVLISATVENATPDKLVLTYDETLNPSIIPFWSDYSFTGTTRTILSSTISGATVTLTLSEQFYTGQSILLNYTKYGFYENSVCDNAGNQVANLTNYTVTNNVLTAVPVYTLRYASNFSGGVDSWAGFSGGGVSAPATYGSETNALSFIASTDGTPLILRSGILTGTIGDKFRITFDLYVPALLLVSGGISTDNYAISMTNALGALVSNQLYQYFRRAPNGDRWVHFEYVYTAPSAGNSLRFEMSTLTLGQSIGIRNIIVHKIN